MSALLYSSDRDLDSVVRRLSRARATLLISVGAIVLVLLGTIARDAADSIAAAPLVLLAVMAPWIAVVRIGYLRTRGECLLDDLPMFNRGQRGGTYWFVEG